MEIILPFSKKPLVVEGHKKKLKYSAILSKDSLFYAVIVNIDEVLEYGKIALKDISVSDGFNRTDIWESVIIAYNNPIFCFVSSEHYDPKYSKIFLNFSNHIVNLKKYQICDDYVANHDLWIMFAVPKPLKKFLRKYLGNYDFIHYQQCFLTSFSIEAHEIAIKGSLVGNSLNLALLNSGKLILSNTYPTFNESEFYYFISLFFVQYNLTAGRVKIYLQGDFDDIHLDRNRFHSLFGVYPKFLKREAVLDKFEIASYYMPLLEVNKCV